MPVIIIKMKMMKISDRKKTATMRVILAAAPVFATAARNVNNVANTSSIAATIQAVPYEMSLVYVPLPAVLSPCGQPFLAASSQMPTANSTTMETRKRSRKTKSSGSFRPGPMDDDSPKMVVRERDVAAVLVVRDVPRDLLAACFDQAPDFA